MPPCPPNLQVLGLPLLAALHGEVPALGFEQPRNLGPRDVVSEARRVTRKSMFGFRGQRV